MHRHRFGFAALLDGLDENEALLDVMAVRAHEGGTLEARHRHGVVLDSLHQNHICSARHTTHRTYSLAAAHRIRDPPPDCQSFRLTMSNRCGWIAARGRDCVETAASAGCQA